MDLSRRHAATGVTATPSIFAARRTVVLPAERPELRCNNTDTCAGLMSSFFTASDVAAAALVWIRPFIHPGEFGADGIETQTACGHEHKIAALESLEQNSTKQLKMYWIVDAPTPSGTSK